MKRFPSPRCASAIQIVRLSESTAETQPQVKPALLRLSAIISPYLTGVGADCVPLVNLHYFSETPCALSGRRLSVAINVKLPSSSTRKEMTEREPPARTYRY